MAFTAKANQGAFNIEGSPNCACPSYIFHLSGLLLLNLDKPPFHILHRQRYFAGGVIDIYWLP